MSLKALVTVVSLQTAINSGLIATGIALAGNKIGRIMGRRGGINAAALQGLNLGGGIQRGSANFGGNLNSNMDLNLNANLAGAGAGAGGFGVGGFGAGANMAGTGGGDALGALIGASLMSGSSNSANMNVNRSTNFDVNINGGLNGYSGLALIGNGQTIPISTININNKPIAIGGTLGVTGASSNNMSSMSMSSSSMSSMDASGSSSMAGMDMSNSAAKVTFENLQLTPDGIPGSAVIAP